MIRNKLITLPRLHKRLISLTVDVLIIWLSVTSAFLLRVGWDAFPNYQQQCLQLLILAPVIVLPINIRLGLYRAVLRYMNSQVVVTLLRAGALSVTGIIMATYAEFFKIVVPKTEF